MTGLRIALVGHIRHPIAPPFAGGMEALTWHLAEALVARGHDVTLFASGDSHTSARLRPIIPVHYDRELPWSQYHGTEQLNAFQDEAFAGCLDDLASGDFDVIHNNSLHRFPPRLARREGVPSVTSLHVPPFDVLRWAVHGSAAPWSRFAVCSSVQRRRWWAETAPGTAHVVPNGIQLDDWPFVPVGDGSAVWFGRITPNKGPHVAIDAARALGLALTLYGVIEDGAFFADQIAPRLDDDIEYAGHLDQQRLAQAVGRASLCLFTPLWDEPFGLAAAEAMACGVPVAALPNGAAAEVVGPGGVVATSSTAEALALAGQKALDLPRKAVHLYARAAFAMDRMVADYEQLYRLAISHRPVRADAIDFTSIELPDGAAAPAMGFA